MIAEKTPKPYNGFIGVIEHVRKAMVDVNEVTSMALRDYQKA